MYGMRWPIHFAALTSALIIYVPAASATGAYATPSATNAAQCIKLCNDDSLCVGWTFAAGACGLWAGVPNNSGSGFTLGERAPEFAREPKTYESQVNAAQPAPTPIAPARRTPASERLLGGNSAGSDLRPRLGGGS